MKNKLLNKTSALLIAGIMMLSITACSGGSAKEDNTSGTPESTQTQSTEPLTEIPTIETQTLAPDDDTAETETLNENTESSSDTTESTTK